MRTIRSLRTLVAAFAATAVIAACDQAPTSSEDGPRAITSADKARIDAFMGAHFGPRRQDSPHKEPVRFQFVAAGGTIYTYRDGDPASTLSLPANTSTQVTVNFYDARNRTVVVCGEADHDVEVQTSNAAVFSFAKSSTSNCQGTLNAVSAGSTTFRVVLEHLGTGGWHADWTTAWLPVSVS